MRTLKMQSHEEVLVDLFYDVRSPFGWVGFEALTRYSKVFSVMRLRLRPINLVTVGRAAGSSSPIDNPAKAVYSQKDLFRLAEYFQLPLHPPKDIRNVMFVKGTQEALQLLMVVQKHFPEYLENLSRAFFLRVWSTDSDVTSVNSLREACIHAQIPEKEIRVLIKLSQTDEAKQAVEQNNQEALGYGAFGVPTYVAHFKDKPKMFFGNDRLFMLAYYLNIPFPGALNEFKSLMLLNAKL